jgi:predicted DNA-binding transcriptional regulator AlpA/predicted XRE-type DNA-binding protein
MGSNERRSSGNVFADLGIAQPDVELAKADLAIRIQRLVQERRLTPDEAAALLRVPSSELVALFHGRLATCSLDQLLRMLTFLGDDVEIAIRPRVQRTKRGALRVFQAAAVERPEDFEPVRIGRRKQTWPEADLGPDSEGAVNDSASTTDIRNDRQLLDKYGVEKMTSLDITTIYRRMRAGTFPQPVRVGRRRVAWRTLDIVRWQQDLEVGTGTARRTAAESREGKARPRGGNRAP